MPRYPAGSGGGGVPGQGRMKRQGLFLGGLVLGPNVWAAKEAPNTG